MPQQIRALEVSLSPALFPYKVTEVEHFTVVIDVLRFTTSVIAAFDHDVAEVIPVASLEEAKKLKLQGFPVAAERDGKKLPFADYGNSARGFDTPEISGKTLVYSTTNGTLAMVLAEKSGPVLVASFTNLRAVSDWLNHQQMQVVILCSGWKNLVSIEDTLCAGALVEMLMASGAYVSNCDSAALALDYWKNAKNILHGTIRESSHYQRLIGLGIDPDLEHTLQLNSSNALPVFENGRITNKSTII